MAAETLLKVLPESSTAHVGGVSTHEAVQRVVEARFSVVSVLGKGSFGAAVLVRPLTQPDNLLVLKIPTAIQARTILRSEAEILCSMSHPRVIFSAIATLTSTSMSTATGTFSSAGTFISE